MPETYPSSCPETPLLVNLEQTGDCCGARLYRIKSAPRNSRSSNLVSKSTFLDRNYPKQNCLANSKDAGFTLIELGLVIVILGLMFALFGNPFSQVEGWKVKSGVRQLLRTWEAVFNEAITRSDSYRLIFDLDNQTYFVRREISSTPSSGSGQKVDLIANLRTRKEKERRAQKEAEETLTLDEEFKQEDERQARSLDVLFYDYLYSDSDSSMRLGLPIDFPELGNVTYLPQGLEITGIKVRDKLYEEGQPFIRVSARSGSEFAVIYVVAADQEFTLVNDPGSGTFLLRSGHLDFEWTR